MRRIMPTLMPTRTESVVYFEQELELGHTLRWLEERPELRLFHLVLAAYVRTLAERPQLNRFVAGGKVYQRDGIEIAFAVKKRMADEAGMTMVKVRFEPDDTLELVRERVEQAVGEGRSDRETSSETEMRLTTKLPGPILRALLRAQRWLDAWGLLPAALLRSDPLYASLVVANLGSVGIDAAYHHLYEYGTVHLFATLGKVERRPVVDARGELALAVVQVDCLELFDADEPIEFANRRLERLLVAKLITGGENVTGVQANPQSIGIAALARRRALRLARAGAPGRRAAQPACAAPSGPSEPGSRR